MSTVTKTLSIFAATLFAFVGSARAQLVTYETISSWTGSVITLTSGQAYAQTFSNVSQVASMTYLFASYNNVGTAAATFSASFVEWNTTTNTAGAVVQSLGTLTVPASNTWTDFVAGDEGSIYTYGLEVTLNEVTDPLKSYALVLTSNQTRTLMGFTLTNSDAFSHGYAYSNGNYTGLDWGFSQLVVEPAGLTPIPESGTVAGIAAGVLVAGLVGFRLRQRKQAALVAAPAAS